MKRMLRGLLRGLQIVPLLLFMTLGASWALSYTVAQYLHVWHESRLWQISVTADTGRVSMKWSRKSHWEYEKCKGFSAESGFFRTGFWPPQHQFLFIGWERDRMSKSGSNDVTVVVPHGYLMLLLTIFPVRRWLRSWRHRRRTRKGLCVDCGYDLRATPDRCPECGLVPAPLPPLLLRRWRAARPRTWCAIAASACLVVGTGWFMWYSWLDPLISIRARADVNLERRSVYFYKPLNAACLRYIAGLPGKWSISLPCFHTADPPPPGIFRKTGLQNIESLYLERRDHMEPWLREMAEPETSLSNVTRLGFRWGWTVADFRVIARPDTGLTNISEIMLHDAWGVGKEHFAVLIGPGTGLKHLRSLGLADLSLNAADMKELARPDSGVHLKRMFLTFIRTDDAALAELTKPGSGLSSLEELDITVARKTEDTRVTPDGLSQLARHDTGLKSLRQLELSQCECGDALLKAFARPGTGLSTLDTLRLHGTRVTAAGLKDLARPDGGLKRLTELSIKFEQITPPGIRELVRPNTPLAGLKRLVLNSTKIGDLGLRELCRPDGGLKSLTHLHLCYSGITDQGLAELARPSSLPALQWIDVSHNHPWMMSAGVTPAGIAALQAARPGLKIVANSEDY